MIRIRLLDGFYCKNAYNIIFWHRRHTCTTKIENTIDFECANFNYNVINKIYVYKHT